MRGALAGGDSRNHRGTGVTPILAEIGHAARRSLPACRFLERRGRGSVSRFVDSSPASHRGQRRERQQHPLGRFQRVLYLVSAPGCSASEDAAQEQGPIHRGLSGGDRQFAAETPDRTATTSSSGAPIVRMSMHLVRRVSSLMPPDRCDGQATTLSGDSRHLPRRAASFRQ